MEADVVVVNHHLFFADVMLKDEGASELLPACNAVILDEANESREAASLFYGEAVSTGQMLELARDARAEAMTSAKDFSALPDACGELDIAARELRLKLREDNGRIPGRAAQQREGFDAALAALAACLTETAALLETQAERAEGLQACWNRALELKARLARWQAEAEQDQIRWVEVFSHAVQLHTTPLSVAEKFRTQLGASARAWIFTSATLSVKSDFIHYQRQLGLQEAVTARWESPFDFPHHALLFVPRELPQPNTPGFTRAVVEAALPTIAASRGRAFCLFTSLRALDEAKTLIREGLQARGLDYPVLAQGEGSRSDLLARFRKLGNAVLLGSQSFWAGVDVHGDAPSLVVIDKLPFAPPDDPVLAARIEEINRQGGNAFMDYQLPRTVISLKQGAGRLIRDEADRGVLMICDLRLITRPYGRTIWQGLPPMQRTRELSDVQQFFAEIEALVAQRAGV